MFQLWIFNTLITAFTFGTFEAPASLKTIINRFLYAPRLKHWHSASLPFASYLVSAQLCAFASSATGSAQARFPLGLQDPSVFFKDKNKGTNLR